MIDFRYHLVSLISVFLALAVGVVLGAGPLQNSLGTALNDQVSALREDRNATQARLEQTETAVNERDDYITQAAAQYLPGKLSGKSVALVLLPGANSEDAQAVVAQLEAAGAAINGRYTLTPAWVDASRETFRSTYSAQFAGNLGTPASSDTNAILGEGLGRALTGTDASASTLMSLLTASDTPLVTVDAQATGPATMIAVVGPRPQEDPGAQATARATDSSTPSVWAQALSGTAAAAPTVVVGQARTETGVVALIRSAGVPVTTIDSVGQATAAVSTPLALVSTEAGTRSHYGFDDGAQAVIPPMAG
ncbi:copper transporter [Actinomyces bowdenii]|uniref:Copper transporter n=1 Tax=Actinomyces bowdenii TaxID=131109 RepID=A0A3P1V6E5_9ACTO|nr:copper transporter [Actinomyces bowdenii]MBO3724262.1 copper transporter [Actinomyces bowdenii]RRD29226.1 copper transporter [Actinomyces bowdenii]